MLSGAVVRKSGTVMNVSRQTGHSPPTTLSTPCEACIAHPGPLLQSPGNYRSRTRATMVSTNTPKVRASLVTELTLMNRSVLNAGDAPSWNNSIEEEEWVL